MSVRWRDPAAFRADPAAAAASRPTRRQVVAVLAAVAAVTGAVTAASYLVEPSSARSFELFHGSLFLSDAVAPVGVDLATGQATVRLADANAQVGAKQASDLAVVPITDGTMLLNRATSEFNLVDSTGFVRKPNGGVPVERRAGASRTVGLAAKDFAYLVQGSATGTSVFLVGASTVAGAAADAGPVRPRASASVDAPGGTTPGSATTAGNDLWMLSGNTADGGVRRVLQLALPADSAPGVKLDIATAGTVTGPAAIATARAESPDWAVGVADSRQIVVHRANADSLPLRYTTPVAGLDAVLAAGNSSDWLSFLLHGTDGWSVVSARADGSGLRGPTRLGGIPADAQLVAPAASRGALYTMDAGTGRLFRVDADGATSIRGMASYPLTEQRGRRIERGGFGDAYAVGRGPRVVFNSPSHNKAVVLFTDGSQPPLAVDKGDAVVVSVAGGAEALTRSRNDRGGTTTPKPADGRTTRRPVAPVNNRIDCTATSQKPHIPLLGPPVPGSRSVLLNWSYPVLGQEDCVPSTYVVSVTRLTSSSPAPPAQVTVQGQRSLNLSGLFPGTRYEVSVTAYLNGRGTVSAPIQVTTGPEGPTAPAQVTAVPDASGNWQVSWTSCGEARSGCMPAQSWRVIPQFCDDRGLSGAPEQLDVPADPTSRTQPGAVLRGGDALLGRGVRFQIEGIGDDGQVGAPSDATACTSSWSPPDASAMRITASQPGDVAVGSQTSTNVSLDLGGNAVRAVGGVGATITFELLGPSDTTQTRTVQYDGRTSNPDVSFSGVRAGATYRASASVSAPGHPGTSVRIGPVEVSTRNSWPTLGVAAACPRSGLLTCDLSVTVLGITSADVGGARFDLTDDSALRCGQVSRRLERTDFDPGNATITVSNVSQLDRFFGDCSVTVGLLEHDGDRRYFGAAPSPRPTAPVSLGAPAQASAGAGDFSAQWSTQSGSSAQVTYTGSEDLPTLTEGWAETLIGPDGETECGSAQDAPTRSDAAYVPATQACIDRFGDAERTWQVRMSYRNKVDGSSRSFTVDLTGAPPSYQPCAPSGPQAQWGATRDDGVNLSAGGDLAGCGNWVYELTEPSGDVCNRVEGAGAPPVTIGIPSSCGTPSDGWQVTVSWTRPDGTAGSFDSRVPVSGDPPS